MRYINVQLNNTCSMQVISDKQLVKHLQTELARLESELRTPDRGSSSDILIMEKDRKIRQVKSLTKVSCSLLITMFS